eukprot:1610613-Pyramimonas_sp.AAC.1
MTSPWAGWGSPGVTHLLVLGAPGGDELAVSELPTLAPQGQQHIHALERGLRLPQAHQPLRVSAVGCYASVGYTSVGYASVALRRSRAPSGTHSRHA